jgi:PmbA protein
MDTSETIDQALNILRRKSVDGYEIVLDQSTHFEAESKDGKIDTFQSSLSWGMGLRILSHRRIGFSYMTSPSPSQEAGHPLSGPLERMVEDAIGSAEVIAPDPCFDFAPPLKGPLPELPIFDERLGGTSEKVKIEKAKLLEEAARSVDPARIEKVRKAAYEEAISRRILINSNGLNFSYPSTLTSVSVMAVAEESGEAEVGWDFDYNHYLDRLEPEKTGQTAGRMALERLGGKKIPSGVYPVLLHHRVASEFLSVLAHSFLAEQVQKGKSPLRGKRGERCFSSLLTIVDNGLLPEGISTFPVDGEGTPSKRTLLVIQGELNGYLYDRYWANRENISASRLETESTGNSRRSGIKAPPGIGVSNLFIEPGDLAPSGLMEALRRGLVVEEVMGLHTVDPISGDFSLGCSGRWVEKGERVHPVKSIAVAGNLFQLFRDVIGVGEDIRFFGGVGSPSLLIRELEVSGA